MAHRAVAGVERTDRGEQLLLRLGPAAGRDQDPAVVEPAGRGHEVAPGDVVGCHRHPLFRTSDVGRALASAQQPAIDLAHGGDAHDLAARDRSHRLVEQRHPLSDAPGVHVRVAQQRERAELEVRVAEAPSDA